MFKKIFIIGKGSGAQNHIKALNKINKKFIVKNIPSRFPKKNLGKKFSLIKNFNPDYIIISSAASTHYEYFKIIEKIFKNKTVLIEKPLFNKFIKLNKIKNNKYFVGYNFRYHPVSQYIKKYLYKKKIFNVYMNNSSFLPQWRKDISYENSVSAQKKLGGGVRLELSHDIDYLNLIFGNLKILYVFNKKISNLKINCDDILLVNALTKKNIIINLSIDFFSRIKNRKIIINGKDFCIKGDFLKNAISLNEKGKLRKLKFDNFNIKKTYRDMHLDIMKKTFKYSCSIQQAYKVQKTLEILKDNK